jgi:hypothetical protein
MEKLIKKYKGKFKLLKLLLALLTGGTIAITINVCSNNTIYVGINPQPNSPTTITNSPVDSNVTVVNYEDTGIQCKIIIFNQFYSWKIGDDILVEEGSNIEDLIQKKINKDSLNKFWGVVCVGTASEEIENSQEVEERRAYKRANNIVKAVDGLLGTDKQLFILNLGRYTGTKDIQSYMQRRIIILCIQVKNEKNTKITESTINHVLTNTQNLTKLRINQYSKFYFCNTRTDICMDR